MRRFAFLFTICLVFLNLSAQSLFQDAEKATAGESQQPALKLNGFARGVVFGGGKSMNWQPLLLKLLCNRS